MGVSEIQFAEWLIGLITNAGFADGMGMLFIAVLVYAPWRRRLVRALANGGNGVYATKAELATHAELDAKNLAEFRKEVMEKLDGMQSKLDGFIAGFTAATNHNRRASDEHNRRKDDKPE